MKNQIMESHQAPKGYKPIVMFIALITLILALNAPPALKRSNAQNLPTQVESLRGREWIGSECCKWQFAFTQKSGPFFRAKWWNPNGQQLADDNITINILNDTVEIIRAGGSSAGGCTYRGTIRVGSAGGEYWCNGRYAGTWAATIRP